MAAVRTFSLILACLSFIAVIGGAVYEHTAMVPVWTKEIPASLTMFQGEYAIAPAVFWRAIHPVTMLLFVAALTLNWKTARRFYIIFPIAGYALVLAITFVYFVPELLALTQTAYAPTIDAALTARGRSWEFYSLLRLVFLIVLAIILLFGLSKSAEKRA
ncbi:MAG: hypothetical protein AAB288_03400 [Acidobacteriota bacterium]